MKVAVLFLTRRGVNHPAHWEKWLDHPQLMKRIHTADGKPLPEFWEKDRIPTIPTQWGDISLVRAMLKLLEAAYEDDEVTHFIFASESCLPVISAEAMVAELTADPRSRFGYRKFDGMSAGHKHRLRCTSFPKALLRIHSQWVLLARQAARMVLREDMTQDFAKVFAADEHYIGSVLAYRGYREDKILRQDITYVDWGDGSAPATFRKMTPKLSRGIASGVYFARKFPPSFDPADLANVEPVVDTGVWEDDHTGHHRHDPALAEAIGGYLTAQGVRSALDLGCGPGDYVKALRATGQFESVDGVDGNPHTPALSDGTCEVGDLSVPLNRPQVDVVISLEVGQHVPRKFEAAFLCNVAQHASRQVILSWAIPGQGGVGHVNCRPNSYIIERMAELGFARDGAAAAYLRKASTLPWFKNTIMVFHRV